ncbi:MAG: ATPase [Myxococcales bacterium]|nr:MAG: ATPase [Myxococcales bacterium]
MNPTSPQGLQISTPTDTTIVLSRTFNAPRPLVWEAMFTPDKMRRWMLPPPGWTMTTCECDARVGGALSIAWKSDEADPAMTLRGKFTEVAVHEHAIHTEEMALGTGEAIGSLIEKHAFSESGGATAMRITQTYKSKADRDGALASGMDQGMEACYQKLEALLAPPAQASQTAQ